MLTMLRRTLSRKVRVDAMIEFALIMAIPYLLIGVTFTVLHPEHVAQIESQAQTLLPAGSDVAAFGESMVLWPILAFVPDDAVFCSPRQLSA